MHEYRLSSAETPPSCDAFQKKNSIQSPLVPMESWILCRIFFKKRGTKSGEDNTLMGEDDKVCKLRATRPVFYEFLTKDRTALNLAPSSSSSGSSGITEVSSNESDDHEESSRCKDFPYFRRKP
uniref:NAC domain-containing protein n=2 Tax=Rhizophora mucronata TaxID=61149 RepID=A0A2P2JQL0_RHIMU